MLRIAWSKRDKRRRKPKAIWLQSPALSTVSLISLLLGRDGGRKEKGEGSVLGLKTGVRRGHPGCASQGLVAMRQSATSQHQPESHRGGGKRLAKGKLPRQVGEGLLYIYSLRMMCSLSESTCKAHTFISKRHVS